MKQYDSYKDSGVQWIGRIPTHWKVLKIKLACSHIFPGATPSTNEEQYWDGDIPWIPSGCCQDCEINEAPKYITKEGYENSSTKLIPAGTALIAMTGATCAKTGYLNIEACANQSVTAYVAKSNMISSRYVWYILQSAKQELLTFQSGGAQGGINVEVCKNLSINLPPLEEQRAISTYLDKRMKRIDDVIIKREKQVELLEEMKKSVISRIVTHGLSSNVQFKDSGKEWFGLVPKHWEIITLKRYMQILRGGSPRPIDKFLSDEGYNWIKIGDTIKGDKYIRKTSQKIKKEGAKASRFVYKGDLILSNSMTFGEPYILDIEEGCIHDGWLALSRLNKKIDKDFLYYFLISKSCKTQFEMSVDGGVVKNLNIDKVGMAQILLPPIDEQQAIVKYLDAKCKKIEKRIQFVRKGIDFLKELKQTLISNVVTGKMKVC